MSADTAPGAIEAQPWPVNARFGHDFVTQLILGMSTMTVSAFAEACAAHVVGKRVPVQDRPMQVVYEGRVLDPAATLVEAGVVPLTNVYVDYVGDETVHVGAAGAAGAITSVGEDGGDVMVGPVLRMGDEVHGIIRAIEDDNPDAVIEVVDRGAYVRIQAPRHLRVTRAAIERELGRAFLLRELEARMSAFAGRIQTGTDEIVWYVKGEGGDDE